MSNAAQASPQLPRKPELYDALSSENVGRTPCSEHWCEKLRRGRRRNIATVPGRSAAVLNEPAAFDQTFAVASPCENALGVPFRRRSSSAPQYLHGRRRCFVARNSWSDLHRHHCVQLVMALDESLQFREHPRKR